MTRSYSRRVGVIVGLVALAVVTSGEFAGTAGAATINPCKVLKKSEIQSAFGGTVSKGKKGLTTAASTQCEYHLSADGDRPDGTVTVHVMFKGSKVAYNGLKKTSAYEPIEGVPNSLWTETTHTAHLLERSTFLGVQGVFLITDPLPIHSYDDKSQLTALVQIGAKRV